jgi:hypothetical protein
MTRPGSATKRLLCGLSLTPTLLWAGVASAELQQEAANRLRTLSSDHFDVVYPERSEQAAHEFLRYAEKVYDHVNELFAGVLPAEVTVTLVEAEPEEPSGDDIVLNLEHARYLEPIFARELVHRAGRAIVGPLYDAEGYRFFREGLAAWVAVRYERALGLEEPRWLWSAYAYMEEATYFEYLEVYSRASEELGRDVIDAVGYTFVEHLVDRHAWGGLLSLLRAMADNVEVCSALDDAGFDCSGFWEDWQARLGREASKHDFTMLPEVLADLQVSGEGDNRDLTLRVYIRNPEATSYLFFVAYEIDGEQVEESYPAEGNEFEALVPLGEVSLGTKVLWEVAVWSRTVRAWRKSGWQDRLVK